MKRFLTIFFFSAVLSFALFGKDTVYVSSDLAPSEGNLNNAVTKAISDGKLSSTVFKLEPLGFYVLIGTISVPVGEVLEIVGPPPGNTATSALPQILWTSSSGVATDFNFECYGDIILKNLWLRYATTAGAQVGTTIGIIDDSLSNLSGKGELANFDGVMFDYAAAPPNGSGAISVTAKLFKGSFKNCYFKNCIDTHLRYYGRAVSFPYNTQNWHIDSLSFENCTFANLGYVYMQESNEYGDNVQFNHCTFYNVVQFTLESGWWKKMSVTNSVFTNTYMYGDIPSQTGTGDPNGGTIRIDSIVNIPFSVPFTEQDRRVLFANNSYGLESWLPDWMANSPYAQYCHQNRLDDQIPVPQPMLSPNTLTFFDGTDGSSNKLFPYMNKANLFDQAIPGFIKPPINLDSLKPFLNCKWDTNCDHNWSYEPTEGLYQTWPLTENLAYTNETLKSAAMSSYPLGDLYHWWPDKYTSWKAQQADEHSRIAAWLEKGKDPLAGLNESSRVLPSVFTLGQNYPNPFNPVTKIEYTVPKVSNVTIVVYNLLGQKVATLFDGMRQAGKYSATFDGTRLSSGVYLYSLQAGTVTITKKLVLMK